MSLREQEARLSALLARVTRSGSAPLVDGDEVFLRLTADEQALLETTLQTIRVFAIEGADRWVAHKRGKAKRHPMTHAEDRA